MKYVQHSALLLSTIVLSALGCLSPARAQNLQVTVTVNTNLLPEYIYDVKNVEAISSGNWISAFSLSIGAPITNVISPQGWGYFTDDSTFIIWTNNDGPPYPNDVPPLSSATFGFDSIGLPTQFGYQAFSWDHINDQSGPIATGNTLAPFAKISTVPEPGTYALLSSLGLTGAAFLRLKRRR